jgi:hypothetical protein
MEDPGRKEKPNIGPLLAVAYQFGSLGTFLFLTFFDGYPYNWWNWIPATAANGFSAAIWPIYWGILRPFFGL